MREARVRSHPIVFWAAILVVAYGLLSGGIALATLDECGDLRDGSTRYWRIIPPEWECRVR